MITLTADDLTGTFTEADRTKLTAVQTAEGNDPVASAISESLSLISTYCSPAMLPDNTLRFVWRRIAVYQLYLATTEIPDKRKKDFVWALKFLEDVRDGKFRSLPVDESLLLDPVVTANGEVTQGLGGWGSRGISKGYSLVESN